MDELVEKYRELNKQIAHLQSLSLSDLVDELMPSDNDAYSIMRKSALIELEEMEDVNDLLDCVRTCVTQPVIPEEVDYVRVMSLHKSKGLTSKVAIVSGCTHGLIPYAKWDKSAEEAAQTLQEQRRLFYVAITRCTETLVISSATRMERAFAWKIGARVVAGPGMNARTIASQFIDELGPSAPAGVRGSAWAAGGYA